MPTIGQFMAAAGSAGWVLGLFVLLLGFSFAILQLYFTR